MDYTTKIVRRCDLSSTDKCFLLWCWYARSNDEIFCLGDAYGCIVSLAKVFNVSSRTMRRIIRRLRRCNIIIEKDKTLYVVFTR